MFSDDAPSVRLHAALCLLLALLTAAVYHSAPGLGFAELDDNAYITENPALSRGLSPGGLSWAFTTTTGGYWMPLTWVSLLADHSLFGLNPGWFHLTNVVFHLGNTLLLYALLFTMTRAPWRSFFAAALFAVHPMHVESVAWIAERKDVLSGFFWMLAALAYARRPGRGVRTMGWTTLFFTLGLMSKPMVVTLPFVLLLLDYWPLGRLEAGAVPKPAGRLKAWGPLIFEKAPLFVLAAVFSAITFVLQSQAGAVAPLADYPMAERLANSLTAYGVYLAKIFWPVNLAVLHPLPEGMPALWKPAAALAVLAAVTWAAARAHNHRYLMAGWLLFLGVLFPVIGVSQSGLQLIAERFVYLPLIGLCIMAAWGAADLAVQWRISKRVVAAVGGVVLASLAWTAAGQARIWRDDATLMRHCLAVTKPHWFTHQVMAASLARAGDLKAAVTHYEQSLSMNPASEHAWRALGEVRALLGEFEQAEMCYKRALAVRPDFDQAWAELGGVRLRRGDLEGASQALDNALWINPEHSTALFNLGNVCIEKQNPARAIHFFQEALRVNPSLAEPHFRLADIYSAQGRIAEAARHYQEALRIDPGLAAAHNRLGILLAQTGQMGPASRQFRLALEKNPDYWEAACNWGKLLLTAGDYEQAAAVLAQAARIRPDDPEIRALREQALQARTDQP